MDPSPYLIPVYAVYGAAAVALTVWLARVLFQNGAVFLEEVFAGDARLGQSVNRLLVVGFYLLNLGYASMSLRAGRPTSSVEAIEILSEKLGALLLALGAMHFLNLLVFHRIRRRARLAVMPPPVAPQLQIPPPGSAAV